MLYEVITPDYAFSPDADFPVIYAEKNIMGGFYQTNVEGSTKLVSMKGGTATNAVPNSAVAIIKQDTLPKAIDKITYELNDGLLAITADGIAAHASLPHKGDNARNNFV